MSPIIEDRAAMTESEWRRAMLRLCDELQGTVGHTADEFEKAAQSLRAKSKPCSILTPEGKAFMAKENE